MKGEQLSLFDAVEIVEQKITPTKEELDRVGVSIVNPRWLFRESDMSFNWGTLPFNKEQKAFVIRYLDLIEDKEYKQWLLHWMDYKFK